MLQLLKNKLNQLSDFIQASDPLRKKNEYSQCGCCSGTHRGRALRETELRKQAQRAGEVPGLFHCYLTRSGRIFKAEEIKRPQRLNGLLPSQRQIADKGDN